MISLKLNKMHLPIRSHSKQSQITTQATTLKILRQGKVIKSPIKLICLIMISRIITRDRGSNPLAGQKIGSTWGFRLRVRVLIIRALMKVHLFRLLCLK